MRRDAARLVADFLDRERDRAAAHDGAAAAERADALLDRHRVAVADRHVLHADAHLIRNHLREDAFVPLAVRARTRQHGDLAGALDAHRAALEASAAARLDERRDADAGELAALARRVALGDEPVVVGELYRLVERFFIVAGIVLDAGRRLIRKLFGSDEVLPPDLHPIDAQIARGLVDQPLDIEHRLRPARAAVGTGRNGIGEYRQHLDEDVWDLIAARRHRHHALRRAGGVRAEIRAQVRDDAHLEAQHRAVALERKSTRLNSSHIPLSRM